MQNALLELHNTLCLSGLSHANELEMMEPSQVDGNLPLAWPWNISDSSHIIDAAKVQRRDRWGVKSKDGGCARVIPVTCGLWKCSWVFFFICLIGSSAVLLHMRWRMFWRSWAHLFGGANGVRCLVNCGFRHWLQSNLEGIIGSDWRPLLNTEFESILEILSPEFWNESALKWWYVWVLVNTRYDHWISQSSRFYSFILLWSKCDCLISLATLVYIL